MLVRKYQKVQSELQEWKRSWESIAKSNRQCALNRYELADCIVLGHDDDFKLYLNSEIEECYDEEKKKDLLESLDALNDIEKTERDNAFTRLRLRSTLGPLLGKVVGEFRDKKFHNIASLNVALKICEHYIYTVENHAAEIDKHKVEEECDEHTRYCI